MLTDVEINKPSPIPKAAFLQAIYDELILTSSHLHMFVPDSHSKILRMLPIRTPLRPPYYAVTLIERNTFGAHSPLDD